MNTFRNIFVDGYHLSCSSRPDGGGGGVCVYVSEKLEASVTDIPLTGAEAMMGCQPLIPSAARVGWLLLY